MRPWRPPFHASPATRKGPISSKRVFFFSSSPGRVQPHMGEDKTHCVVRMGQSKLTHENEDWCNIYKCASKNLDAGSQDPLLRKFGNFSLNSLNFHPNFSSQAPKFGNFQLTSPPIWKFSTHKPPFSEANVSLQAPHFGNPGRRPLPEKKLSAPPGSYACSLVYFNSSFLKSVFQK